VVLAGWITRVLVSPDVGEQRREPDAVHEGLARRAAAREFEGQHAARAARQVPPRPLVVRMRGQVGVHDPRHAGLRAEPRGQRVRVLDVPLGPQAQRLQPLDEQAGVVRG
jgi:hypothetical protein